ncbi:MAG TPA: hypothetical protein VF668_18115 [Pyrinomonadaceae bacterium]|jgi:hypothetical protein
MSDRSERFSAAGEDPEATLVAPRFDAEEARRAHPVVPLAEAPSRARHFAPTAHARRGVPRSWTPALLIVALLAAAGAGAAVTSHVLNRAPSNADAAPAPAAVAPAQAADAPPVQTDAEPAAEPPREMTAARPEPAARRAAPGRRADEDTAPARDVTARADAEAYERKDEDRPDRERGRGHEKERGKERERRRERGEDVAQREMRKALKRAGEKAPRLVDVLVGP